MAEFVRKGTKGAVGKMMKADGVLTKDVARVDLSLLSAELPKELDQLTEQIKDNHKAAIGQMGRAVIVAARAGQLLLAAKVALPKEKKFTEWLAETFDFSQRTAYNYMKVSEAMSRRAAEIEQCESIRDVLKLLDADTKKKAKDPKQESVVSMLAKVERWIVEETDKSPVTDWETDRRENVRKLFDGVARFHSEL
jgi:hypothetical protein